MIFLLTTFVIGILNLNFDAWMIARNKEISHVFNTAVVGMLWIGSLAYLYLQSYYSIYEAGCLVFIAAALRWFYHDFFLSQAETYQFSISMEGDN